MKKLNLALVALTAVSLASCSSDEPQVAATDGQVTFTINLPGDLASRAPYGDGLSATQLHYTIYEVDAQGALDPVSATELTATFATGSLSTTIQPALVRGRKYQLLFWADAPQNGIYTFSPANKNVTVDYDVLKTKANTDAADGFFGASDVITIGNTAVDQTVTLTRPFAQLNVGTNDLTEPTVVKAYGTALANLKTQVKVSTNSLLYNTLSLVDGAVSGTVNDITFDAVAPAGEFPVSGYQNLSMDYLLVDPTQIESTVELTFNDGTNNHVVSVPNVPLQRNYRTNIYGSLLTVSPTFTVTKDPIFGEPALGGTPEQIKDAHDWAAFVAAVNGDGNVAVVPAGKTYDLHKALPGDVENNAVTIQVNGNLQYDDTKDFTIKKELTINFAQGSKFIIPNTGNIIVSAPVTINGGIIEGSATENWSTVKNFPKPIFNIGSQGGLMSGGGTLTLNDATINVKAGLAIAAPLMGAQVNINNTTINTESPWVSMDLKTPSPFIGTPKPSTFNGLTINAINGGGGGIVLHTSKGAYTFENCHINAGKSLTYTSKTDPQSFVFQCCEGNVILNLVSGTYTCATPTGYTANSLPATFDKTNIGDNPYLILPQLGSSADQYFTVTVTGGQYVSKGYDAYVTNRTTNYRLIIPATGYKWQEITPAHDGLYWEVVPE